MEEATKRVKKIINWLIFKELAENEKNLAEKLGYTNSSFSQLVNGRVPLSDKFVKALCSLDDNINFIWVKSGEGKMFLDNKSFTQSSKDNSGYITNNVGTTGTTTNTNNYAECERANSNGLLLGKAIDEIAAQRKIVMKSQEQIDRLISLLEKS